MLREDEAKGMLREFGISTPEFIVLEGEHGAEEVNLPFPLVAKVCSDKMLHKTEVGGVRLGIEDTSDLVEAIQELRSRFPGERILVETMEHGEIELIAGVIRDEVFGLTLMFGLGGILAELYKDVVFRTIPIDEHDAEEMMSEIRGSDMLEGFRGFRVDKARIKKTLLSVSRLAEEKSGTLKQLDLNPILVSENNLVAVDVKAVLKV